MPRFFIDFQDGDTLHSDDEGSSLLAFEQARDEAVGLLPQIARDQLPDGEYREFVATVRDKNGVALYRASLTFRGEHLA